MLKFLVDENLSPLLAHYLRDLNYNASAVREVGLKGKSDMDLVRWIQKERAILITSDLDFGEFFYWQSLGKFGVVIIRSKSQKYKTHRQILEYLHQQGVLKDKRLKNSLVMATKGKYRWRKFF
jgi:predicted nuclease of predicted toxin-antitoxin system